MTHFPRTAVLALVVVVLATATAQAASGDLDSAFGQGGIATLTAPGQARAITIDRQGRLLVAWVNPNTSDPTTAVTRLRTNGTPDPAFGTGGTASIGLGGLLETPVGIFVLTNDRILIVGTVSEGPTAQQDVALARLLSNGKPDTSFDVDGRARIIGTNSTEARDALVDASGRVLIVTTRFPVKKTPTVMRLMPDSMFDPDFGADGTAVVKGLRELRSVAQAADGTITALGHDNVCACDLLLRLTAAGKRDAAFGSNGLLRLPAPPGTDSSFTSVAVASDGKILVAGSTLVSGSRRFVVERLSAAGVPDATFEGDGIATSGAIGADATAAALAISGAKLYVVGTAARAFVAAAFKANGKMVGAFGLTGIVRTTVSPGVNVAPGALLGPSNRLVVSGDAGDASHASHPVVLRYVA